MIRVTTGGVLSGYKSSLNRSRNKVNDARNQVLTQRNFNSYAEDPAAATRAFQLRRSAWEVDAQLTSSESVSGKFQTAFKIMMSVNEDLADKANGSVLTGLNSPTGSGRKALGQTLTEMADSIVQNLNTKYGKAFIFNGSDGANAPFSWNDDKTKLLFRGIDVNAKPGTADYDKLKAMAGENLFADLGLGLQEDATGNIIPATAFDSALSGLNVLGFGTDADGDPKNLACIVKELGTILARCDADSAKPDSPDGSWHSEKDQEDAMRLQKKLDAALTQLNDARGNIDSKTTFLNTNHERLKESFNNINEQLLGIEQIDLADAITNFTWAQTCYNAALKVGNSIMSQSLLDYMN